MSKLNVKKTAGVTKAPVRDVAAAMLELRRTVACCLLWEDTYYEDGESTAARLSRLVPQVPYEFAAQVAVEARTVHGLRHAPLLLLRELARHPGRHAAAEEYRLAKLIPKVCTRADQLAELVKLYWLTNDGKKSLPAQMKKGLAAAFERFGAYELAKNDHQSAEVKLRDVAFLAHPSKARPATLPDGAEPQMHYRVRQYKENGVVVGENRRLQRHQGDTLDQLCENKLPTPQTWEVLMSAAKTDAERRDLWAHLMSTHQLGGLAWLRNLRKMDELKVGRGLILEYGGDLSFKGKLAGILPFQFLTAARVAPWAKKTLEPLMLNALEGQVKLDGRTVILVDVSGSMDASLSAGDRRKGPEAAEGPTRIDAALGLAMHAREVCKLAEVWTFSDHLCLINPAFRGFELAEKAAASQAHSGTALAAALRELARRTKADRTLVITDEQSDDGIAKPLGKGYVMNVATYQKGVGNVEDWTTISGWAPAVLTYVAEAERLV